MRSDPRTKNYIDTRTGEGLSTKEILICLKRNIVRELYPLILSDLAYADRSLLTYERQCGGRIVLQFIEKRTEQKTHI